VSSIRPFALVDGGDSWARASHHYTFLELEEGVVELAWTPPGEGQAPAGPPPAPAGLAFDAQCRLYRSDPAAGQVARTHWRPSTPLGRHAALPPEVELFEPLPEEPEGDFAPEAPGGGPLAGPRGLAVDVDDRLFVAETGAGRILVFDLWSRRLLRTVPTPPGTRPLDLAADGHTVWAVLEGSPVLLKLTARTGPELVPLPPEVLAPTRVAVSPEGELAVLVGAGTALATVVPVGRPHDVLPVPRATDIEWESDDVLVAARFPGETFRRFRLVPGATEEQLPLMARGYDGMGIARAPDGRIGFWTAHGFRPAATARVRYAQRGLVMTYRLDAGEYQSQWGRLFLDACVPAGTALRAAFFTTDEVFDEPALNRALPGNLPSYTVHRFDLSPAMPPMSLLPEDENHEVLPQDDSAWRPLHRRESGRELAWAFPQRGDTFVTYEAPVDAGPGRFLWVALELTGNSRVSPRVRSLRAERRGHDYLRRIPKTFSRDPVDADFLRRYLAIFEGLLGELENEAAHREYLLDPHGTPEDLLPWLASFLGMALDERWPAAARRTLVAEAARLFRFRGTVPGLARFLEIYLGEPVIVLEHFRLRGMGGGIVGEAGPPVSRAVLGGGFRVGGAVGDPGESPLTGTTEDAFATHAHRFSVMVRGSLDAEQLAVVNDVLEVHRPAHTLVEVCTLGAGMRVGRGLHVGISSTIGHTGGFRTLQLGGSALGRGFIVGRPEAGTVAGAGRLNVDTRVG
jgi:phage tail-like protein